MKQRPWAARAHFHEAATIMRDFLTFLRHLFEILHFIRGVILAFILPLVLCVVVMVLAEGMSVSKAAYLVLITALTIGYGDITPVTAWGKASSVVAGVTGLLFSGIIIAAAVRALGQAVQEKRQEQDARK
jgi:voltage-gated potassium channel